MLERVLEEDRIAGLSSAASNRLAVLPLRRHTPADIQVGGFLVDVPGEAGASEPIR